MTMYPLSERVNEIRNLTEIDNHRKEHLLRQNMTKWLMLGSCMNTIKITEKALESFLTEDTDSFGTGKIYSYIYGALAVLVAQQDAVKNLHVALDIKSLEDSSLDNIRNIRKAVEHSTDIWLPKNKKAFGYINFGNSHSPRFAVITDYPEGDPRSEREYVEIPDLITTQKDVLIDVLDKVIETLKEEETGHRKKFAGENLTKHLQITDPFFSYIYDATTSPDSPFDLTVATWVDSILNAINEFKTSLKEREEPDYTFCWRYEKLDYALQHIKGCFGGVNETHIDREDAYIFAKFAQQEVKELKKIAKEIDERYTNTSNL